MKNTIPAVISAPLLAGLSIPNIANTNKEKEMREEGRERNERGREREREREEGRERNERGREREREREREMREEGEREGREREGEKERNERERLIYFKIQLLLIIYLVEQATYKSVVFLFQEKQPRGLDKRVV